MKEGGGDWIRTIMVSACHNEPAVLLPAHNMSTREVEPGALPQVLNQDGLHSESQSNWGRRREGKKGKREKGNAIVEHLTSHAAVVKTKLSELRAWR